MDFTLWAVPFQREQADISLKHLDWKKGLWCYQLHLLPWLCPGKHSRFNPKQYHLWHQPGQRAATLSGADLKEQHHICVRIEAGDSCPWPGQSHLLLSLPWQQQLQAQGCWKDYSGIDQRRLDACRTSRETGADLHCSGSSLAPCPTDDCCQWMELNLELGAQVDEGEAWLEPGLTPRAALSDLWTPAGQGSQPAKLPVYSVCSRGRDLLDNLSTAELCFPVWHRDTHQGCLLPLRTPSALFGEIFPFHSTCFTWLVVWVQDKLEPGSSPSVP